MREKKRHDIKKAIYVEIYEQAKRKIRRTVDIGGRTTVFEIPSYVMGMPSFDREKALRYIVRQFENDGFRVYRTLFGGWNIEISWSPLTHGGNTTVEQQVSEPANDYSSFLNLRKTAERLRKN